MRERKFYEPLFIDRETLAQSDRVIVCFFLESRPCKDVPSGLPVRNPH